MMTLNDDDDDDVHLIKITTWQWVTKSVFILTRNKPERYKHKMKSTRKKYSWLGIGTLNGGL
jgi:hypothetical protein